jgi:hypothetical protein
LCHGVGPNPGASHLLLGGIFLGGGEERLVLPWSSEKKKSRKKMEKIVSSTISEGYLKIETRKTHEKKGMMFV